MSNQSPQIARATNLDELGFILSKMFTDESRQKGYAFQPRSSDIFISPYAKCGTTWLQQIAHGLRTRGSMDFDAIISVMPWIDIAHTLGWDLDAPQVAAPRVFKSHASWHDIPKGARYICSLRNPADAFVSWYRFFEGFFFEPDTISPEEFFHWVWPRNQLAEKGYWYHLNSWWEQRNNKDVLLLCYEDMKADLVGTIKNVANFMNIDLDDELLEIVTRQSSRKFMLAHKEQFSELPFRQRAYELGVLPLEGAAHKVTLGSPSKDKLPSSLKQELDDIWVEQIQTKFGIKSYEELRTSLKSRSLPN